MDQIDLRAIDAKPGSAGDQPFRFIGMAAFSHTEGEFRVPAAGSSVTVSGDVDGDGVAEFEFELKNFSDPSQLSILNFRLSITL